MPEDCKGNDCPMANRISALEADNNRHKDTHSKMYDRIGALEKNDAVQSAQFSAIMEKLERMDVKYDRLADKMESMERTATKQAQTLDELNERGKNNQARLDALEAKPGKRWDGIVEKSIWAVAAAVIAFLLAKIGL